MKRQIHHSNPKQNYAKLILKGFCMGAADIVPGVSGGTMAFILGIYKELVESISSFDAKFIKLISQMRIKDAMEHFSWQFLAAIGSGILIAILSCAKILEWLLQNRPALIWSFFFGLILASVFIVARGLEKWSLPTLMAALSGGFFTFFLVGMMPAKTPDTWWFLFFSGAIAICAMILPGISGAFILVLIGKYHYILSAVNNRDLLTLFLVLAGAGAGLLTFVHLLKWLFNKYNDLTLALLTGFLVGSLRKIWPWKSTYNTIHGTGNDLAATVQVNIMPSSWNTGLIMAVLLIFTGFLIIFSMDYLAKKKK